MNRFIAFVVVVFTASMAQAVPAGWQQIKPGGDTLCARGGEFSFLVRKGDPKKILVSFAGGGACWDDLTCDTDKIYTDTAEKTFKQVEKQGGIYSWNNNGNPYKGWTHVFVPYCTGDVHVGSADTEYNRPDNTKFKIYHRGGINAKAVIKWLADNYQVPDEVNVDGCSAGSYASILWTPAIAEKYPQARIAQFGDSGAGVADSLFFPQWRLDQSLPNWIPALNPAVIDWEKLTIVDIYKSIANHYPKAQFAQFNHHQDRVQILYYAAMGGAAMDWTPRMFKNMEDTGSLAPNFKYFVAPGKTHCSINNSSFYTTTTDGTSLSSWLWQKVQGQDVENVKCKECSASVK
ncbi:pectin acetylesterase-family hydrolase [Bdellovibrio sp. HCB337]|uniref:pectin acetylesterase-family hydrolase n=1 Tax=Bdellovibrio sp. HCB337 TaxID=3394358 RepID=UPI0039A5AB16